MKKYRKFIIPAAAVLLIAGMVILYNIFSRFPANPVDASGNTTGNLANGGTFCEYNGKIYFANPYDYDRLYRMNPDCTEIERILADSVSSINACGGYLYYVRNNSRFTSPNSVLWRGELYGVVRTKLDGSHEKTLYSGYCSDLSLAGNSLVFHATDGSLMSTFRVTTDGKDQKVIYPDTFPNASAQWNTDFNQHMVYYSDRTASHSVYAFSIEEGTRTLWLTGNTYMATVYHNSLYYIDLDNHYALTRVDLQTLHKEVITTDHVVLYNIYEDMVFCQTENSKSHHMLKRMKLDGSDCVDLMEGDIVSISCTSRYTFVTLFGDTANLYRVPTRSGNTAERFTIVYN